MHIFPIKSDNVSDESHLGVHHTTFFSPPMRVLRVRCVDDGRELLVERHGVEEYSVQVAELKMLILQQRQQLHLNRASTNASYPPSSDLEDCFILLRGQILADPDVVDLNALKPLDFFVFALDAPQSGDKLSSRSEMRKDQTDFATFELLRSQLVDMGFSMELAAQALRQSRNNLSDAAALLAEGRVDVGSMDYETKETDLVAQHPSITPIRSLVYDENVDKLRQLAAKDSFQALLLLKEQFSTNVLNQLNENPVATLRLLSLPTSTPPLMTEVGQFSEEIIDVEEEEMRGSGSSSAVDRLVAMGFDRDLVEVMYESCGGDEQLTAKALLQTLDS